MNKIKILGFRCYQLALKIALPFLPYRDPIIIDKIEDINKYVSNKVLIVTDKSVYELGLTKKVEENLKNNNISYSIFYDVCSNPTSDNVKSAYMIYKGNACKDIIAIGGGSPMDCAKALGALVVKPKKELINLKGILKVRKKIPNLIAIPTTAGTGSETTLAAVIVDSETRLKFAINDFPLIPKYAVLDPYMTMTLPKFLIATTGMDALTHAIEAYIGKGGNKKTRGDALEAMKIIFSNLSLSYNTNDIEPKKMMLIASHKAGRAFSKAYVGYVHALAHALGGKYNTPHGLANSIILPIVLEEYGSAIYKKMKEIAVYCNLCSENEDAKDATRIIINRIKEMNKEFNIPISLDIKKEDIADMAKKAYREANPLYPVPVIWDINKLEEMYCKIGRL
ncbi:MAG: iron-containing alcohol dehydrogenase [Anaeroplasma sp.]